MDRIREEALLRHERHIGHPTHRPLSPDYELVGLRGEEAFAREFDLAVDLIARPRGDGGVDYAMSFSGREYGIDVKCARKPGNLIVEAGKVRRNVIYVLGRYCDIFDEADLLGWEWGVILLRAPTRDFGYGVINHFIPRQHLRHIDELKAKADRTRTWVPGL